MAIELAVTPGRTIELAVGGQSLNKEQRQRLNGASSAGIATPAPSGFHSLSPSEVVLFNQTGQWYAGQTTLPPTGARTALGGDWDNGSAIFRGDAHPYQVTSGQAPTDYSLDVGIAEPDLETGGTWPNCGANQEINHYERGVFIPRGQMADTGGFRYRLMGDAISADFTATWHSARIAGSVTGTFVYGETITWSGGGTGTYQRDGNNDTGNFVLEWLHTGGSVPAAFETATGATSGATAQINTTPQVVANDRIIEVIIEPEFNAITGYDSSKSWAWQSPTISNETGFVWDMQVEVFAMRYLPPPTDRFVFGCCFTFVARKTDGTELVSVRGIPLPQITIPRGTIDFAQKDVTWNIRYKTAAPGSPIGGTTNGVGGITHIGRQGRVGERASSGLGSQQLLLLRASRTSCVIQPGVK